MDDHLKSNAKIVFEAAKTFNSALLHAPPHFKSNRLFLLKIIKNNPGVLSPVENALKHDKDFLLSACIINRKAYVEANHIFRSYDNPDRLEFLERLYNIVLK